MINFCNKCIPAVTILYEIKGNYMPAEQQGKQFKQWVSDYKDLIFKVIRAYAYTEQDREDLFQNILLGLWTSINRFEGRASEKTWVYRVALNTALVWQRGQIRKRKGQQKKRIEFERSAETQDKNHDSLQTNEVIEQLYKSIRELPKIDSCMIFMYLEGISYEEMAEVLGISKGNVGVRLNRAKKRLSELMKGLIDDF